MLLLAASLVFGVWCVINRLKNFRATETVARMQQDGKTDVEIKQYRDRYEKLGKRTWGLF
jgi:hypothetical protein